MHSPEVGNYLHAWYTSNDTRVAACILTICDTPGLLEPKQKTLDTTVSGTTAGSLWGLIAHLFRVAICTCLATPRKQRFFHSIGIGKGAPVL